MLRFPRIFLLSLCSFLFLFASSAFSYQQIEFIREIGEHGKPAGQRLMNGPRAIALFGDRMFIADTEAHRVLVLNREGKTLLAWGTRGDKPGQFKFPHGIDVDELGRVYVSDTGNGRIQAFDAEGKFLRSFGTKGSGPKQFSAPRDLPLRGGCSILPIPATAGCRYSRLTAFSWAR